MSTDAFRDRLYEAYATTHAGLSDPSAVRLSAQRDILPHLPTAKDSAIVDLGCGQGLLVRWLQDTGYKNASGIDISPEQIDLARASGVQNVRLGSYADGLSQESYGAVTATDFLEHLSKSEVVDVLDAAHAALRPGGVLIARVPNAVSPFGGLYQHGDFTHETSFTARSLRQLAAATSFRAASIYECRPIVHGTASAARAVVWRVASGAMKLALAAETGMTRGHIVTPNLVVVMTR